MPEISVLHQSFKLATVQCLHEQSAKECDSKLIISLEQNILIRKMKSYSTFKHQQNRSNHHTTVNRYHSRNFIANCPDDTISMKKDNKE